MSKFLDERQIAKFSIMGGHKEYFPKLLEVMDIKDVSALPRPRPDSGARDDTIHPSRSHEQGRRSATSLTLAYTQLAALTSLPSKHLQLVVPLPPLSRRCLPASCALARYQSSMVVRTRRARLSRSKARGSL